MLDVLLALLYPWLFPGTLLLGTLVYTAGIRSRRPVVKTAGAMLMLGPLLIVTLIFGVLGFVGTGR